MTCPIIHALINEGWRDPASKALFQVPIASVVVEEAIAASAGERVKALDLGQSYLLVCDVITYEALGAVVEKGLQSLGRAVRLVLPLGVKADSTNAETIRQAACSVDAIVAVGSGTINDLCKYASFQAGKPYLVFGTAPSMNGYVSANASITIGGHKKTVPCRVPRAVFLDLDVLAAAPKRLIQSGLGDSLCRPTAQADWLLSHLLLKTPYSEAPFIWLKTYEEALFSESKALVAGDKEVLRLLCYTLLLSGLGMVVCGGSYPASQGEHLIAHTMEMASSHENGTAAYHGEQIAVTSLSMAALQYRLLEMRPVLKETPFPKRGMAALLGREVAAECVEEFAPKRMGVRKINVINNYIECCWDGMVERLAHVMIPQEQLRQVLIRAGMASAAPEIGWQEGRYMKAMQLASFTRSRFTFLDMARLSVQPA